jgi:prepilin-type N-terminal cleavage/methylation domain-containing protein
MVKPKTSNAFTLVELLVVICIIGVLTTLLLAGVKKVQQTSRRGACAANMRQIVSGVYLFAAEQDGKLPYNYSGSVGPQQVDGISSVKDYWRISQFLAPYVNDQSWDCVDPLNRQHRRLNTSRGEVWSKVVTANDNPLTVDSSAPQFKRLVQYPNPAEVALFYCAFSPVVDQGTPGNRPWPHGALINQIYLDGHVEVHKVTWPDPG